MPRRPLLRRSGGRHRNAVGRRAEEEARLEVEAYLELRARELEREGLAPEEARRRAETAFGSAEEIVARCRRIAERGASRRTWAERLASLPGDLRSALRVLVSRPLLSTTAMLTLALGIGASTALFSVVDAVLLRPLPYPAPERLVRLFEASATTPEFPVAPGNLLDYRELTDVFDGVAAYLRGDLQLSDPDEPAQLTGLRVSAGYFETLGRPPRLGRGFTREDEVPDTRTAVISDRLWRERFHSDPGIVGATLSLDGSSFTIIGVAPAGLRHVGGSYRSVAYGEQVDVWWPLWLAPGEASRGAHYTSVIARLRQGINLASAQDTLSALSRRLQERYPESNDGWVARLVPLRDRIVGRARPLLLVLMAAVAVVLTIACVNVANLLLAASGSRLREIAVRAALGASRGRLARQLLFESGLLAVGGGLLGVAAAAAGVRALVAIAPPGLARIHEIGIEPTVLAFATTLTLATGLAFGLAPTRRLARQAPAQVLRQEGDSRSGTRRAGPLDLLVVLEAALAGALLVGAFLLLHTFINVATVDTEFGPQGVLSVRIGLPGSSYPAGEKRNAFYRRLRERALELPGVTGAGFGSDLPWDGYDENTGFHIVGWTPPDGSEPGARYHFRGPGYFAALDIPVIRGRELDPADTADSEPVLLINQAAAERYWGTAAAPGSALGATVDLWGQQRRVVGIVGDVMDGPTGSEARPALYVPISQWPHDPMLLVLESDADPVVLVAGLRRAVREIDPRIPIADVRSLASVTAERSAGERFALQVAGLLAISALALTAIGLYGVLAFDVSTRRREVGIRIALGADSGRIVRGLVSRGVGLAATGLVLGMLAASRAGAGMRAILYGVEATDPLSYAGAASLLLLVALVAAWLPARRAARLPPVTAMR